MFKINIQERIQNILIGGSDLLGQRGSIRSIYPTFFKIPHENEIIWTQMGATLPNPSGSTTDILMLI